jgi:hypothetical protein
MTIEIYLTNIKNALRSAELKLAEGNTVEATNDLNFASDQISKKPEVFAKFVITKEKEASYSQIMNIFQAKCSELHINLKFQIAWNLLVLYKTSIYNFHLYRTLDTYLEIKKIIDEISSMYEEAREIKSEEDESFNMQPFINIPTQLGIFHREFYAVTCKTNNQEKVCTQDNNQIEPQNTQDNNQIESYQKIQSNNRSGFYQKANTQNKNQRVQFHQPLSLQQKEDESTNVFKL